MRGRSWRADLVHAAHVLHGGVLLARPAAVAARFDGGASGRAVAVVRVLGARHVLQGLAGLAAPRFASPAYGAALDGLHAASMAGLALLDRDRRWGASVGAAVAFAFAFGGRWAAADR